MEESFSMEGLQQQGEEPLLSIEAEIVTYEEKGGEEGRGLGERFWVESKQQ